MVSLQKGQKVDLTKSNPGMSKVVVGLGWDINGYDGGGAFDLDAASFLIDANGKVTGDGDFVFYNNKKHSSGAVETAGDNLTGQGDGDDEQIKVDLSLVPENIAKIVFTVTINEAETRHQNFGQVANAYIRIMDAASDAEVIKYDLSEDYSIETALVVGELYRHGTEWKFTAVGAGFEGGLQALCTKYGL